MADSKTSTHWFLTQTMTRGPEVEQEAKLLMESADLLTVPYFPLPSQQEAFKDTEGRFPMKELAHFLENSEDVGSAYWYARVLPENGDPARAEYLVLSTSGDLTLRRGHLGERHRALLTVRVSEEPG